ncbi:MAG: histidinol-phosphate transaminase [Candidatus Omnitrophota bacterium]
MKFSIIEKMVRPALRGISPYRPGKPIAVLLKEKGLDRVIKLASNENPLGPSLLALKAITNILPQINRYPEGTGEELRQKLAGLYRIKPTEVILGSGSSEVLALALLTFLYPGEEVLLPEPTFSIYEILVLMSGGTPVNVPLKEDFAYDLKAMEQRISEKTRAIILGNPNNPTGTIIKKRALTDFLSVIPDPVMVILDEAYAEYVEDRDFESGLSFFSGRPLLVARTFSKLYGLAALRIGYGIADGSIIVQMNKIRPPFNTTLPAQAAATAALDDRQHVDRSLENNRTGKQFLYQKLSEMNISYLPTEANFILIDFQKNAPEICKRLEEKGVIVRPVDNPKLYPRYIRLTIGTPEENRLFIDSLREVIV